MTGHEDPSNNKGKVKWNKLASSVDTIVILMGISTIKKISIELINGGMNPKTPFAVIYEGTTRRQSTKLVTLKEASKEEFTSKLKSPGIIVVGKVAELGKKLGWFQVEKSPDT